MAATKANPPKGGDAKPRGYREQTGLLVTLVGLPNAHSRNV